MHPHRRLLGSLLILGAALLWGTTGTAQTFAPEGATPLSVGTVRMLIGGAGLVVVAAASGGLRFRRRPQLGWWLLSAAAVAAYQLFFFAGVRRAGVALGTVVAIGSAPILAGALAALTGDRPGRRWAVATLLAVGGVAMITGGPDRADALGVALALGAGASYAVYALGSKQLVGTLPPLGAMALVFGSAAVLLAPVAAATDTSWLRQPSGWGVALWLGLATTTAAYVLFGFGLRHTDVATAATLSLGEPVTATLLGVVAVGERPGATGWLGVALVLGGLLLVAVPARPLRALR